MPEAMMWVFAVLIVLAMGGIALLAAGRGEPMRPAYDDRPDARVPLHRTITPDDLRRVRFSLAFRGYRMSEVDALLARIALEQELSAAPPQTEQGKHAAPETPGTPETPDTPESTEDSGGEATSRVWPPPPPPQ
jgi:DivIVA domain-containing protein